MVLGQPDIRRGAGGDDGRAGCQVIQAFDGAVIRHQSLHRDFQVGVGEVHRVLAFRRHGHVGENQVDLVALQEGNAAGRFHGDKFHLVFVAQQVLGELTADVGIEADITTRFVHKTEWRLVGKHADNQLVPRFDFVDVAHSRGFYRLFGLFIAAGQQGDGKQWQQ